MNRAQSIIVFVEALVGVALVFVGAWATTRGSCIDGRSSDECGLGKTQSSALNEEGAYFWWAAAGGVVPVTLAALPLARTRPE